MGMVLRSPAFPELGWIPEPFACAASAGASPPLVWWDPPPAAKSFAIVCDDLDATDGRSLRWALCDIPAGKRGIAEGYPAIYETKYTRQGTNDFGSLGYFGGCPSAGPAPRHFRFRLFAVAQPSLSCERGASARLMLARAIAASIAVAQLVGARPALSESCSRVRPASSSEPLEDRDVRLPATFAHRL